MDVQVNYLGVLAATVVAMIIGSIWYSPKVFAKEWAKLARIDMTKDKGSIARPMIITLIVCLITAYVLAHVSYLANQYFKNSYLHDTLLTSFWVWLGFCASRITTHDAFESRPMKLTAITLGSELVTFVGMGLAIGLIGL